MAVDPTIPLASGDRVAARFAADGKTKIPQVETSPGAGSGDRALTAPTYKSGVSGAADVPSGHTIRRIVAVAPAATDASLVIQGGDPIPLPAGTVFDQAYELPSASGADVTFTGTLCFFVPYD